MDAVTVSAADGRSSVLFAMKRGLPKGEWGSIEAALSDPEKEPLKKYGERRRLLTWGLYSVSFVIVVLGTWAYVALRR